MERYFAVGSLPDVFHNIENRYRPSIIRPVHRMMLKARDTRIVFLLLQRVSAGRVSETVSA
jgi:hypothetical protein